MRKKIKHYYFIIPKYERNYLQATTIKVKTESCDLFVAAVYSSHRHNMKKEHLNNYFGTFSPKFIVGCDYNCKHTLWGSRLITTIQEKGMYTYQQEPIAQWTRPKLHTY